MACEIQASPVHEARLGPITAKPSLVWHHPIARLRLSRLPDLCGKHRPPCHPRTRPLNVKSCLSRLHRTIVIVLVWAASSAMAESATAVAAGETTEGVDPAISVYASHQVESASEVLDRLFANHPAAWAVFHDLLRDAHGFAVFPNLTKAGFLLANIYGRGVLTYRDEDGRWSPPILLTLQGYSLGPQFGLQVSDVLVVLKTRRSLEGLLAGTPRAGMDVLPLGSGQPPTPDGEAEIVSYALRRGLMIGQSIDEYVVRIDEPGNLTLYGQTLPAGEIARGTRIGLRLPAPAQKFVERVNLLSGRPAGAIEWR